MQTWPLKVVHKFNCSAWCEQGDISQETDSNTYSNTSFGRFIAQHGVTTFANLHRPDQNHSRRNLQNQHHFYQQLRETL